MVRLAAAGAEEDAAVAELDADGVAAEEQPAQEHARRSETGKRTETRTGFTEHDG